MDYIIGLSVLGGAVACLLALVWFTDKGDL